MLSITNTVRGLFARPATPSRPRPRRRSLRLECLEERTLLCNPGELDLTFDGDGKVTTGGAAEMANDVALQTDGKIVVAGSGIGTGQQGGNFTVARYTASGALDTTFGGTGLVLTDVTKFKQDAASAVAIQSDGKIIVAGFTTKKVGGQDTQVWALVRYNTNGTLDSSFGSGGKAITNIGGRFLKSIVVQPDGKIVAAGEGFTIARFNTNGTLDTTFGTGGTVTTDFGPGVLDYLNEIALQPDVKIVAVGQIFCDPCGYYQVGLARYNTNGSLDSSFGTGGKVISVDGAEGRSVAIQTDGKIVVVGPDTTGTNVEITVARFNSNGSLDTSFGTNGIVYTPPIDTPGPDWLPNAVAIQTDGKILVAGRLSDPGSDFLLARFDSSGSLDASFDTDGIVTTDFGASGRANAMALQPDGKVVLVGWVGAGSGTLDFALARYNCSCP